MSSELIIQSVEQFDNRNKCSSVFLVGCLLCFTGFLESVNSYDIMEMFYSNNEHMNEFIHFTKGVDTSNITMEERKSVNVESDPLILVTDNVDRKTKRVILKDLVVLTSSFLLVFSAYNALQNLESSLNREHGVGLASLSCIYGGIVVSCLIAPFLISNAGAKWVVCLGFTLHIVFVCSNFYPRLYTLIPSSLLLGFASGPLWTAQGTYVTKLALRYAAICDLVDHTPTLSRFIGFFFTVHQSSNIWGNIFSSLVLHSNGSTHDTTNITGGSHCGIYFCPHSAHASDTNQPSTHLVYVVLGIFLGCGLLGFLVAVVFLGKPEGDGDLGSQHETSPGNIKQNLIATISLLKDPRLLTLIPLFAYTGVEQAFIVGSYPLVKNIFFDLNKKLTINFQ